jgi:hypothetical protein
MTLAATFTVLLLACASLAGQTVTPIYSFNSDLFSPAGPLVFDSAGNAFGTMKSGGAYGYGGIFELSPPAVAGGSWTMSIIHSFDYGEYNTASPNQLAIDAAGNLYGTTMYSPDEGCLPEGICGLVFKLSPPPQAGDAWGFRRMHEFAGGTTDGAKPDFGVVLIGGNVYGTSTSAGAYGSGAVYEIVQSAGNFTENIIYNFGVYALDGVNPVGLTRDADGNLYGVTTSGGQGDDSGGIVYKLSPPASGSGLWTETVLYILNSTTVGSEPVEAPVFDVDGGLWITTSVGATGSGLAGTLIRLRRPEPGSSQWQATVIYNFEMNTDGPINGGLLDQARTVYGINAGLGVNCGSIFQVTQSSVTGAWTYSTPYNFTDSSVGCNPEVPLSMHPSGQIFGLANDGGANGYGTAFQFIP